MLRATLLVLFALLSPLSALAETVEDALPIPGQTAQTRNTLELPIPLTEDAIAVFMSQMSDLQVRSLLREELNAKVQNQAESTEAANETANLIHHFTIGAWREAIRPAQEISATWAAQAQSIASFASKLASTSWIFLLSVLGAAITTGYALERLFGTVVLRMLPLPAGEEETSVKASLIFLTKRLAREAIGVAVFVVTSAAMVDVLMPDEFEQYALAALMTLVLAPRLAYTVVRFVMTPQLPEHRLVFADNDTAKFLTRHSVGMALAIGMMQFVSQFNALNDAPNEASLILFWFDLFLRAYFVWIIWRSWSGLTKMMRGTDDNVSPWEDRAARAFPVFAMAIIFGMWWLINVFGSYDALYLLAERPDILTVGLLVTAPAIDTLIRAVVRLLMPPMTGEGPIAENAYHETAAAYKRIGRIIVFGAILVELADIWDISFETFTNTGAVGLLLQGFFQVSFTLVLAYLTWEIVSLLIYRKLAMEMTLSGWNPEEDELGDGGGTGGTRLTTILPLLLKCARAAILILFGLLILSELGVNIAPLLAGASILGLAIGFGSQKLVTDVVSGVFFLLDDAFRVGEYLDIGGTMGTVEKISIRSLRLRHHRGLLHTIPYSEMPKLTNYSRDWIIMKLKFTVPFGTDPEKVRKIFKRIGQDLLEHPELGKDFIQPFKSQGVFAFDDVGIVIRGKFMAKPGAQFMIRKEVYNRVNAAFAENGIEFARREVRVAIPGLENTDTLSDTDKTRISAAAGEAVQQQATSSSPTTT